MRPCRKIRKWARWLLEELDAGWLEVCKVPSKEGGYIRVPVSVNAEWYQRFCDAWLGWRKHGRSRTIIKRYLTRNALLHLESGRCDTTYACRLMDFISNWMEMHDGKSRKEETAAYRKEKQGAVAEVF